MIYRFGKYFIDKETVFGYDMQDGKLVVNPTEAEIVKYTFGKIGEYSTNPPAELVDEVISNKKEDGEEISYEEAKEMVSFTRIMDTVEGEIVAKWGEYFKKLRIENVNGEKVMYIGNMQCNMPEGIVRHEIQPIVDKETWEAVQEKMRESSGMDMKL